MSLWGSANTQTSAPKYGLTGLGGSANGGVLLTGNTAHQNVRISAFVANIAMGVFGVSAAQRANTGNTTRGEASSTQHAGWNLRKAGTGPIVTAVITTAGSGYTPGGGFVTITGGGGLAGGLGNTAANLFFQANATGSLVNVSINVSGSYASTPTLNVPGSSGVAAVVTITMGGRANRVTYETLVATGSHVANVAGSLDQNLFPL
jgi:hypothetical protein